MFVPTTNVPVIACISISGLELKAALRRTPTLGLRPAALAPEPQAEPLLGPVAAQAAETAGMRPGMPRLGEALAIVRRSRSSSPTRPVRTAPGRRSSTRSRTRASPSSRPRPVSHTSRRGESSGLCGKCSSRRCGARSPGPIGTEMGRAHRRRRTALCRARRSLGRAAGTGGRRRRRGAAAVPRPAAAHAPPASSVTVTRSSKHSEFASSHSLPGSRVTPSPNDWGRTAGTPWGLARGGTAARVRGRRPPAAVAASLEFPEAVGNELTLRRALAGLVETALAPARTTPTASSARSRSRHDSRELEASSAKPTKPGRKTARLRRAGVPHGGGRSLCASRAPIRRGAGSASRSRPGFAELPAPVVELRLELVELSEPTGHQLELLAAGAEDAPPAGRAAPGAGEHGSGSVCTVVEVARGRWCRRVVRCSCRRTSDAGAREEGAHQEWPGFPRACRHGRACRRVARCSCRRTSSRTLQRAPRGARRGARRRVAARGEPPRRRARARGMARRRPVVDRGARRAPLLRARALQRREHRRLP